MIPHPVLRVKMLERTKEAVRTHSPNNDMTNIDIMYVTHHHLQLWEACARTGSNPVLVTAPIKWHCQSSLLWYLCTGLQLCKQLCRCAVRNGDVRLVARVDVNGFATGGLEVFLNGGFGSVCPEDIGVAEATVA